MYRSRSRTLLLSLSFALLFFSSEDASPQQRSSVDLGWYIPSWESVLDPTLPNHLGLLSPDVNTVVLYGFQGDWSVVGGDSCLNEDIPRTLAGLPAGIEAWVQLPYDTQFEAYHDCRNPTGDSFALTPRRLCGFDFNRRPASHTAEYCAAQYLTPVRDSIQRILSANGGTLANRVRGWYFFDEPSQEPLFQRYYGYGTGAAEDQYLAGDWDGDQDRDDHLAIRRHNCIYRDTNFDGFHDLPPLCFGDGNAEAQYLVGNWDGRGGDDIAVRRDRCVWMDFGDGGIHERIQCYQGTRRVDQFLVGDWDGNGDDNLAIRSDGCVYTDFRGGTQFQDRVQCYGNGNAEDQYLVGDWDGDGRDNLAVRRKNCVLMDFDFNGAHDMEVCYDFSLKDDKEDGTDIEQYLVGDWDGVTNVYGVDERDRIAVRNGNTVRMVNGGFRDQPWQPGTMREIRNYIRQAEIDLGRQPHPTLGVLDFHVIETPAKYGDLATWQTAADFVGMDYYPKGPKSPPGDFQSNGAPPWGWPRLREVADRLAPYGRTSYYVGQGQGALSGTEQGYDPAVPPTLREIRWSAWTPLIRGVRNVLFWWWPYSYEVAGDKNAIRDSVHRVFREIRSLEADQILFGNGPTARWSYGPAAAQLAGVAKSHQDRWHLLVSSMPDRRQRVTFTVEVRPPGCSGSKTETTVVTELISGKQIPFQRLNCAGPVVFQDDLEEGAVRVYRLFDKKTGATGARPTRN